MPLSANRELSTSSYILSLHYLVAMRLYWYSIVNNLQYLTFFCQYFNCKSGQSSPSLIYTMLTFNSLQAIHLKTPSFYVNHEICTARLMRVFLRLRTSWKPFGPYARFYQVVGKRMLYARFETPYEIFRYKREYFIRYRAMPVVNLPTCLIISKTSTDALGNTEYYCTVFQRLFYRDWQYLPVPLSLGCKNSVVHPVWICNYLFGSRLTWQWRPMYDSCEGSRRFFCDPGW